jgi:hypothetical protein
MLLGAELANCLRKAVFERPGFEDAPDGLMDRTYGWIIVGTEAVLSMLVLDDTQPQYQEFPSSKRYVSAQDIFHITRRGRKAVSCGDAFIDFVC